MPYPYGTQGAPVVGNGLGGLPRRATVVPASTTPTYPQVTQPLGDWVQFGSQTQTYNLYGYGGVAGSNVFFMYLDGSNDTYIGGVSFTSSSVTALSPLYLGNSIYMGLDGRGWGVGNDFYYIDDSNVLYKLSNSGGSVSKTTIKSTLIPDTGTYTVTGTAYRVDTTGYGGIVTPQFGSGTKLPACFNNGDGTASVFVQTAVSVGGNYNLGCFVINTSGTIVRSFKSGDAFSSIPTTGNYVFLDKGLGQITAFTFYAQSDGTARMYYWATNVNAAAGTYTTGASGTTTTDTQNLSNQQSFYASPTLFSYGAQGTNYYYTWNFNLSDYSASSFINFAQVASTSVSLPLRKMYPAYQDMVYTATYVAGATYYGPLDIKLQSNPINANLRLLNYDDTSSATITPVSSGGTPFKLTSYRAKAFAPSETDISTQFGPQDNASGPQFIARLSATTYLVLFDDYNSNASPPRKFYVQLYQTV